ncbi:MAG: DNA polymerase IV [Bacteroidales bacterium]|nr:DNA polymerase IV [Bacteroidales bacterium]
MDTTNRTIAHFDLDTFFVSVERLHNSSLVGKPVIIGGMSDRGVVAGCSYEARRFGVHSAMPMRMARQLCSQAVFIRGDMEAYAKQSRLVTEIIAEQAPVYEKASIDEHYLDITGMDRFFGSLKWTQELREQIIKHTGLPISFGLSVNKTVSKIATGQAKPNGGIYVPQQQVKPFIFPLSIRKIPMIGSKSFRLLRSMGVSTIQTLSAIPPEMLVQVMGKNGLVVWKKANGIDPSPVVQYSERKSLSTEHTFEQDTTDLVVLRNLLITMVDKLAYGLRKKNKLTGLVSVKIKYANFDTHTLQHQLAYTSFDHVLIDTVLGLFNRLYTRRMLIRLIGVRFGQLVGGNQQLDLFDEAPHLSDLYKAVDQIRLRYGTGSLLRGVSCPRPVSPKG